MGAERRWAALAEKHGVALPSVALAFAFAPRCVTRIVLGMADPAQVAANMGYVAGTHGIPAELWSEARSQGLIAEDIPTPTSSG